MLQCSIERQIDEMGWWSGPVPGPFSCSEHCHDGIVPSYLDIGGKDTALSCALGLDEGTCLLKYSSTYLGR